MPAPSPRFSFRLPHSRTSTKVAEESLQPNTGVSHTHEDEKSQKQEDVLFSVVLGNPTDEELAALIAVLNSQKVAQENNRESAVAQWQRRLLRGQSLGVRLRPGPGSWRHARPM